MTLNELPFELVESNLAEAYIQVSKIPDEQLIINLTIDPIMRSAYLTVSVSLINGIDQSRVFYTKANYAEAENIINKLKGTR